MITWIVELEDVDKRFSLQDLLAFSKKNNAKIVIKGFGVMQSGGITYLI